MHLGASSPVSCERAVSVGAGGFPADVLTLGASPMRAVRAIPLICALVTAAAPSLAAQTVGGSVQGFITDSSGAALPNAQVLVLNVATGATRELTTDAAGRYRVPILPPGPYEVHVTAGGFRPLVRRGIQLDIGQTLVLDLALDIGGVEA